MENNTSKKNPYLIPGAIIVAGLIVALAIFLVQQRPVSPQPSELPGTESPVAEGELGSREANIEFEGFASLGSEAAPITMVEYSDFACPFCTRFWQETLPLIKRDYIDTGKVRLVYKDFIVVGGDRTAEAAHCAQEQEKFWEYHDILFSRNAQDRGQWSNAEIHRGYAKELGLDEAALVECFESRRYQEKVAKSNQEAIQQGGQGTPYFLINGQEVAGAQPYSTFQQVIDSLLAKQ